VSQLVSHKSSTMARLHAVLFGFVALLRGGMADNTEHIEGGSTEACTADNPMMDFGSLIDSCRCMATAAYFVSGGGIPAKTDMGMCSDDEVAAGTCQWTCCEFMSMAASGELPTFLNLDAGECAKLYYVAVDSGTNPFIPGYLLPQEYEHEACADWFYRDTMPGYMKKDVWGNLGKYPVDYGSGDVDAGLQFLFTPGCELEEIGVVFPGTGVGPTAGMCALLGNDTLLSTKGSPDMGESLLYIAVLLLSISVAISLVSTYLAYKRTFYHFPLRGQFTTLLLLPGITAMFAICECWTTKLSAAHLLLFDCQCVIRCIYLWTVCGFSLDMVAMRGGDMTASVEEAAEKIGLDLEKLNLPRKKYSMLTMNMVGPLWMGPSPHLGCSKVSEWFAMDYVPNRAFMHSCVWRIKVASYGFAFCTVMRPFTMDLEKHADAIDPMNVDTAYVWLICVALSLMTTGMSGMLPLYEVLDPMSNPTPDQQFTDKLRKLHFMVFFGVIGLAHGTIALVQTNVYQNTFLPFWAGLKTRKCYNQDTGLTESCPANFMGIPCLWLVYHEPFLMGFELLIVTILGYRCWLPPFKFAGCPSAPFEVDTSNPVSIFLNAADSHTGSYDKMKWLLSSRMSENYVSMSDDLVKEIFTGAISVADAKAKQTAIGVGLLENHHETHAGHQHFLGPTTTTGTADVEVKVMSAEKVA